MKHKRRKWILAIGALLAVWVIAVLCAQGIRTNEGHRSDCLFNQRNVTTAARAYANVNDISAGAPMDPSQVLRFGEIKELKCASGGTYKREIADDVTDFVRDLLSDRIVAMSMLGGDAGGWRRLSADEALPAHSMLKKQFVWTHAIR